MRWTSITALLSVALLGLIIAGGAHALTLNIDPAEDTYLDGWMTSSVMGVDNPNWVCMGIYEPGRTRIGVLKFTLPAMSATTAKLRTPIVDVWGTWGSSWYTVEDIANTWSENTATMDNTWALISPKWADGVVLDSKEISDLMIGNTVEWNVTSAVQAAGPGGTVSFYIAIDHYQPMVENVWTFYSKEGDPTLTNTAKLVFEASVGTLQGYIELQAWDMSNVDLTPVEVNLVPTSGGEAKTVKVDLDPNNINYNYSVADIVPGTYDVYYRAAKHLRKRESGVVITAGSTTTQDTSLINGDVDGDNVLSIGDAGITLWNENMEGD